jgi:hypothetical protein
MSEFFLMTPEGQQIPIKGLMTIGRGTQAGILLKDPEASREHAAIWISQGVLSIRDEGSANGTFINDIRIDQPVRLNPGDNIRIGNTVLTVQAPGVLATPPPVPAPIVEPVTPPPYSAAPPSPFSPPAADRRGISKPIYLAIGCAVALVAMLCFVVVGYAVLRTDLFGGSSTSDADYTIEDALSDEVIDERGEVMSYLGLPDAFTISTINVEGVPVRLESWRYYGFGTRVDFVDGEVAWTIDIEPVPDGTILPAWYDPLEFEIGMSTEQAAAVAASASPAGMSPEHIDISNGGPELVGAVALVGDQILIGVHENGVVYIETIAMFPVEDES